MRKWLSIISVVVIFLVMVAIAAIWQFNRLLTSSNIENLDYQIQTFNLKNIKISELSFVYNTDAIQQKVLVNNVNANLEWHNFFPQITILNVGRVSLAGEAKRISSDSQTQSFPKTSTAFKLPAEWRVPAFFPKQVRIQQIMLKQPCLAGICSLAAKLNTDSSSREQLTINVLASPGETLDPQHQFRLNAIYSLEKNLPKVDAVIAIDQRINLRLTTKLLKQNELYWLGSVKGSAAYLDPWWTPYLNAWNIKINSQASELPNLAQSTISLQSDWQIALSPLLNLPATADATQRKKAITGSWFLDAQIPLPMNFFDLGQFSGKTKIDVEIAAGQLNRYAIAVDVSAGQLAIPDAWQTLGLQADQAHLNIQSKLENGASAISLPVDFFGDTGGALQTKFSGHLQIDAFAKKIIADQFMLSGKAKQLRPYLGYEFKNVNMDVHAAGSWQPDNFSFSLGEPSQLSADVYIKDFSVDAKSVQLMAKKLDITGNISQGSIPWPQLNINSDVSLKIDKLSHPQLKPDSWRWQGSTKGSLENFDVKGELTVGSALSLQHHLALKDSELHMDWKIADLFLLAANPFADLIKSWPPLLSFARGKLNASGSLVFNTKNNNLKNSNTDIQLQDIAGVYDTTVFEGLNANARMITLDKTLKISTDEIKVNQVNKGFIIGPLVAAGAYQTNWEKPLNGKLELKKLNATLMDGSISMPAQVFDFSRSTQNVMLSLRQINLTTLLQQHPASELSGSGRLSGDIPIEISAKGIRVIKGLVAAEAPGGLLKYQSARAAELAKTQPSVKLLTEALSDFHYSILSSGVNYDENGKLVLSVRLQGENPSLEKGRPINLNVNLEEDLPALLASMQLSSKVTDVVKKRLQETIQKNSTLKVTP